jgi:long-chain acyl-CoA synthetase
MAGYWNRPDETSNVMMDGGSLRTGDIARIEERGYVFSVRRQQDMMIVSGFNVCPNEIEEVAIGQSGVKEAGAVGVSDVKSGEAVKIAVVRNDETLTEIELIAHCRQHLTCYKTPRRVEFRDTLPRAAIGRILRRELRDKTSVAEK